MSELKVVEFCGGPLDGHRRTLPGMPNVLPAPVPEGWSNDPLTNPHQVPLKDTMLYALRLDESTGRPATNEAGIYWYDFRAYV